MHEVILTQKLVFGLTPRCKVRILGFAKLTAITARILLLYN
jgi:hypothetical protein